MRVTEDEGGQRSTVRGVSMSHYSVQQPASHQSGQGPAQSSGHEHLHRKRRRRVISGHMKTRYTISPSSW